MSGPSFASRDVLQICPRSAKTSASCLTRHLLIYSHTATALFFDLNVDNAGALVSPLGSPPRLLDERLGRPMVAGGRESPAPKLVILETGKDGKIVAKVLAFRDLAIISLWYSQSNIFLTNKSLRTTIKTRIRGWRILASSL